MYIRTPSIRVKIGDKLYFESGDGFLQSADVGLSEQERASSCSFSIFDPDLTVLDLLLTSFQKVGGVMVPANLLEAPSTAAASTPSATSLPSVGSNLRGDDLARAIVAECQRQGVTMPEQIAYVIATVQLETNMGEIMKEQGGPSYLKYLEGRRDLGNVNPGEGIRYAGKGYIQLTGKVNYERWSKRLGIDLINNPDLAAEPRYALPILVISMKEGITTGKKMSDYIRPGNIDFYNARRVVNATNRADDIAGYARKWLARLPTLGAATTTPAATPAPTVTPPATGGTTPATTTTPEATSALDIKDGIVILIEMGFRASDTATYQYFLTDVRGSNDTPHTTKISGNQLRYVIAKNSKVQGSNKTYKIRQNTTLRQIAFELTAKVGATLGNVAQAADRVIESSYQSESDYEYLLKVAKSQGLFLRSEGAKLNIEELKPGDKKVIIKASALMAGSSWGDRASSDRILATAETTPAVPGTTTIVTTPITVALPVINTTGILELTQKADTTKEIGKGFESTLSINSLFMPEILLVTPGQIVEIDKDVKLGEALRRACRIGEVRHSYKSGVLTTTLSTYLPVKVKPRAIAATNAGVATGAIAGNSALPAELQASPKDGTPIPGTSYKVSSPYGNRVPPKPGASSFHEGVDVPCPTGTPYYPICNPGESVSVICKNGGGGGTVCEYQYGDWIFQYMHCSECYPGVKKHGEVAARCGTTGVSTGPHLHMCQRKPKDRGSVPVQLGFLAWCFTGKNPGLTK